MGILVAIAATGLLVVPLTRWYITITQGADELNDRLTMQTIIQDKWNSINAENYDKLTEAINTKGNAWTENIGKDDRYRIEAVFGDESKYVDAECTETAPVDDDRKCRKVSIQITDTQTGKTQGLSLSKIGPESGSGGGGGGEINLNNCTTLINLRNTCRSEWCSGSATVPNDGYVYTSNGGNELKINGKTVLFKFLTGARYGCEEVSGCGTANAMGAFSPVKKGDTVAFVNVYYASYYGSNGLGVLTFCPNK